MSSSRGPQPLFCGWRTGPSRRRQRGGGREGAPQWLPGLLSSAQQGARPCPRCPLLGPWGCPWGHLACPSAPALSALLHAGTLPSALGSPAPPPAGCLALGPCAPWSLSLPVLSWWPQDEALLSQAPLQRCRGDGPSLQIYHGETEKPFSPSSRGTRSWGAFPEDGHLPVLQIRSPVSLALGGPSDQTKGPRRAAAPQSLRQDQLLLAVGGRRGQLRRSPWVAVGEPWAFEAPAHSCRELLEPGFQPGHGRVQEDTLREPRARRGQHHGPGPAQIVPPLQLCLRLLLSGFYPEGWEAG